jgi:hypothetical protein
VHLAIIENHDVLKYYRPQELKQIFVDKGYTVLSSAGQGYYKKNLMRLMMCFVSYLAATAHSAIIQKSIHITEERTTN